MVHFITSRGIANELVRHRVGIAFSQASTRYINFCDVESPKDIEFIQPYWIHDELLETALKNTQEFKYTHPQHSMISDWLECMEYLESLYKTLRYKKLTPQAARGVLPHDLKTEMVATANLREWCHILELRSSIAKTGKPHPDMMLLMDPLLEEFKLRLPIFFEHLAIK